MKPKPNTQRVVIEDVEPAVDAGRFAVKCITGDRIDVEAAVFADGHDVVTAALEYRHRNERAWTTVPMTAMINDRWAGSFEPTRLGQHSFRIVGWVDHFATWQHGFEKKAEAGQDLDVDFQIGVGLIEAAAQRADRIDAAILTQFAETLGDTTLDAATRVSAGLDDRLTQTMDSWPDRSSATIGAEFPLFVDRERARFSTWYSLFPRSWGDDGAHGTLRDVASKVDYLADMGFDVLYLTPISPIGTTMRKGANNTLGGGPDDPGVPYAIGSPDGGHTAINPDLGTIEDFRALRDAAAERNMEIALDIAIQCSPDHPWVTEHPEWFKMRPDGSIQYAENPPKKYQDIYPIDFETSDPDGLWRGLKEVFDYWIDEGVKMFRIDNPHTKSFAFWEWVIGEIHQKHPDVIFLSEAFTRPKVMQRLAKVGFTQSYTYFTWRNTSWELRTFMEDLAATSMYLRPNFWPNTHDILPTYLQSDGRAAFIVRLVLAATLSSNYGIYGPAYELLENAPRVPGAEEYLDSEKYQIRDWNLKADHSLAPLIAIINRVRREHPALQHTHNVWFTQSDNEMILSYVKQSGDDVVVCVVNLDPHHQQSGWIEVPVEAFGIGEHQAYQVHDAITDRRFIWGGRFNYVELAPDGIPVHIFVLRRHVRTEHDFDYYL